MHAQPPPSNVCAEINSQRTTRHVTLPLLCLSRACQEGKGCVGGGEAGERSHLEKGVLEDSVDGFVLSLLP
jgi:hypothetical protein